MELAGFLVTLGVLFLAGLAADQLGSVTRLPRVTLLLMLGIAVGGAGLDLVPNEVAQWFDELSIVALTMVAFLLGSSLTQKNLTSHGLAIFTISLTIVFSTLILVTVGLSALGLSTGLALLLAAIATATAPAAMNDVISQAGIENGFTETLKGVVAIDDGWGLIVFSIAVVLVDRTNGWNGVLSGAAWDLGGALALGCAVGAPAAFLTGRLKPGEPLQAEAIGIVFLAAGLALWLEVSFLITGMAAGAIIANFASHHDRAFHEIEHIQWPFMILFFLLAGASLEIGAVSTMGWTGLAFLLLRITARIIGGTLGAHLGGVPSKEALWYGPALLPQAGVAVGMALVASERFPEWASVIMTFTIASTVVFEIIGPPATITAIRKVSKNV